MVTVLSRFIRSNATIFALGSGLGVLLTPRVAVGQATEPMQDPLAGSEVFESKGCIRCHAVNGIGGTSAPDLARIPRRRSFYELAANVWNHLPAMVDGMRVQGIQYPELNADEADDLIGFLFTLDYFDAPGDVTAGKKLYTEKKCFVCHRIGDYGGDAGPELDHFGRYGSPIIAAASMWNHSAMMSQAMELTGVERPMFEGSDILDLIAYLQSVSTVPIEGRLYVLPGRAQSGRVVFAEKRCDECHAVQGVGGYVAPDLAAQGRQWGLTEFAAAMWNKRAQMQAAARQKGLSLPQVGAVEMADLVAYLYSVEYFAEPGDDERGAQTLRDKGCLGCHSLQGTGGISATDFTQLTGLESPADAIAMLWNHAVIMDAAPDLQETAWPQLSAEDLADISAFLQSLQNSE
jgi:mono/diheme cytochrome c family protein